MTQGEINAKVERLFFQGDEDDLDDLIAFTDTLTEDQKFRARNHLRTVRAIRDYYSNLNGR